MAPVRMKDKSMLALGLLALAALLRIPLALALRALFPGLDETPGAYYGALIAQELLLYGIPAAVLWRRVRREGREKPSGGRRGMTVLLCLALGLGIQGIFQGMTWLWTNLLALLPGEVVQSTVPMPRNGAETLLAFCALALVPALVEELLFRGGVYPCLRKRFSARSAFWLTVGSFTLMHASLAGLLSQGGAGWIATAVLVSTGSLGASVAFHLGYNTAALIFSMAPGMQLWERLPWGALLAACGLAVIALAVWMGRMESKTMGAVQRAPLPCRRAAAGLMALLALGYLPEILRLFGWSM